MAVMDVGVVGMCVLQRFVPVAVRVPEVLGQTIVLMPMMFVVRVFVVVLQRFVHMPVGMTLGEVQPNPQRHQCACDDELRGQRLAQQRDRHDATEERRDRKVGARARSTQMS